MKLAILILVILATAAIGQLVNGTLVNGTLVNARPRDLTTFADTFDRADADPMTTNASDGIGVWTDAPGALNSCKIALNILSSSPAGLDSGCRVLYPDFLANQSASMVVGSVGAVGLMVRMQSATSGSGYLMSVDDSTHISIYRLVDTGILTYTLLGAQATVATINPLDTVTFSIFGNTMDVYVNGVSLSVTRTDNTFTSGQPGCYIYEFAGSIVGFFATEL